jgi:phage/conjugal plasmid C-4 type zinc finger TraR family protein
VEELKYDSMDFSGSDEDVVYQMREIAQSLAAMRNGQLAGPSLEYCDECGDEIPEARRVAIKGCRTCVYCQSLIEKGK